MDFQFLNQQYGFIIPIILIQLFLMGLGITQLFKNDVNYLPKWVWALIIIFGQILGPVIFLIFGKKRD